MQGKVIERVHDSLVVQRQNLTHWLRSTPEEKKRLRLGPASEQAAEAHLQVLDSAIEKAEDQTLGICEVCHEPVESELIEMDYTCCVCVDHYSDEEKRRLEADLELSARMQQALLPQQVPDIPGLQLAAFSQPARIVSGDYFDFFRFKDGAYGLVIGDVVDKGMPASLLMASLQASLRILVTESDSPAAVAERLNSLFGHSVRLTQFVTLFLGRFDPQTRTLTYCNAGHNPPLHQRAETTGWLQPTGAAIGLIEDAKYSDGTLTLLPGDTLLLYTDGVTEARDPQGEELGMPQLAEFMRGAMNLSAAELLREVRSRWQAFVGSQAIEDDTTIIACQAVA